MRRGDGRDEGRFMRGAMTVLALALALVWGMPARAGYWTVPVNYYELEDIRYPLASGVEGLQSYENIADQSHATPNPVAYPVRSKDLHPHIALADAPKPSTVKAPKTEPLHATSDADDH